MRNLTISIDEQTLDASRKYAKARGLSLNALIRNLLRRTVQAGGASRLEETLRLAKELNIKSDGRRWTRDDNYRGKRFE